MSDLPPMKESGIERPDLERMISRPDREDWSGQVGTLLVHSEARLARYALSLEAERDALREAGRAVVDTGVEVQDGVMVELAPLLALRDLVEDRRPE